MQTNLANQLEDRLLHLHMAHTSQRAPRGDLLMDIIWVRIPSSQSRSSSLGS